MWDTAKSKSTPGHYPKLETNISQISIFLNNSHLATTSQHSDLVVLAPGKGEESGGYCS